HRISRLLEEQAVSSQAQLVELLATNGIVATQATVSRDLEDLGAVKVRIPGGTTAYAIPEHAKEASAPDDHLRRVMGEFVVDVGQGVDDDWDTIRARALAAGAVEAIVVDARAEFAEDFVTPALRANALYEGKYPLVSALSRPVIARHLVRAARQHNADAVAHGCTGKGNDQVRFEVSTRALAPDLEVLAPVRGWGLTREDSIEYAAKHGI